MSDKMCAVCQRPVSEWPMAFRGDEVCSVLCEKAHMTKEDLTQGDVAARRKRAVPKKKALAQMGADE